MCISARIVPTSKMSCFPIGKVPSGEPLFRPAMPCNASGDPVVEDQSVDFRSTAGASGAETEPVGAIFG